MIAVVAVIPTIVIGELEIAEEIAERRPVRRDVRIIIRRLRVRQIVTAVGGEFWKIPVPFDEFRNRGMIGIFMRDVAALGIFRHQNQRYAGSCAKIVAGRGVAWSLI